MRRLILVVVLVPTLAYAQQPQQPSSYTLTISPQELELISAGLGTQPFKDVLPLMNKLRQQVMEQQSKIIAPPAIPPVDKPVEPK